MHTNLPIEKSIALGDERLAFLNSYTENLSTYVNSFKDDLAMYKYVEVYLNGLKYNYSELIETLVSNREPLIEE